MADRSEGVNDRCGDETVDRSDEIVDRVKATDCDSGGVNIWK